MHYTEIREATLQGCNTLLEQGWELITALVVTTSVGTVCQSIIVYVMGKPDS